MPNYRTAAALALDLQPAAEAEVATELASAIRAAADQAVLDDDAGADVGLFAFAEVDGHGNMLSVTLADGVEYVVTVERAR